MKEKQGKVWLVGAGPGDEGLFTLKGKAILESADVVVYDKLVGQGIMAMIPSYVRKISVGKESGYHPIPQEEINRILLKEAQKGNRVVRLKGGDPFVFGRGGEELELLCEHGIPFEIVPGITSAVAVPAYSGIPVTHRDWSSSVHIFTGHRKKGKEEELNYKVLVSLEGTLIFLMGVSAMAEICRGLLKEGMNPQTPAAILQQGTCAHQRRVVSTVEKLPEEARTAGIGRPAILVIGKVCPLAEKFHWAEDRPLGTKKIAVTRPRSRSSALADKLKELGAEVALMPAISIEPASDNRRLHEAIADLRAYRWITFTSPAGADVFFNAMREQKKDIRSLTGIRFAVIGRGTAKVLEERGIFPDLMPQEYSGRALGELLAETAAPGEKILLPRADIGTEEVTAPLQEAGADFDDIPVYHTAEGEETVSPYDSSVDCVAFTSASTVRGFMKQNPDIDPKSVNAVCIGAQTAKEAEKYGMKPAVSAEAAIESLTEKIQEVLS